MTGGVFAGAAGCFALRAAVDVTCGSEHESLEATSGGKIVDAHRHFGVGIAIVDDGMLARAVGEVGDLGHARLVRRFHVGSAGTLRSGVRLPPDANAIAYV